MKKFLFSIVFSILSLGIMLGQTTKIYVSAYSGFDFALGTSWQSPLRSIDAALDKIGDNPGDYHIYVAQGKYTFEENNFDNNLSGRDTYRIYNGQNITIEGGYSTPTIDGGDPVKDGDVYVAAFETQTRIARSVFYISNDDSASLVLKDLTIVNAKQGDLNNGSLLTFDHSLNSSISMDNVKVNEWRGGDGESGRGLIFVRSATNTNIDIQNSLIERTINKGGAGQFVRVSNGSRNVDINVDNSIFRNLRGIGVNSALFLINLNCDTDKGESSLIITNSKFYNNKRGLVTAQSPSVIKTKQLPKLTLLNNVFQGNAGGSGAVINFGSSGEFISKGNIYQGNYGGYAGTVFIHGSYTNGCSYNGITDDVTFEDDIFFSNRGGKDGINSRGAAIMIANTEVGDIAANKKVIIRNSEFSDNFTVAQAGGAVFANTTQDFIIENSIFCNNEGNRHFPGNSGGSGGAINIGGNGKLTVANSTFVNNKSDQNGGAIDVTKDEFLLNGCSYFVGNQADNYGGAISLTSSKYEITGAYFNDNKTIKPLIGGGGAISVDNASAVGTITDVNFIGNTAFGNGGAINNNSTLTLDNVNFERNESFSHNGGAISSISPKVLTLNNVNFHENKAKGDGGAVRLSNAASLNQSAVATISNSYFTFNTSREGNGGAISLNNYGIKTDDIIFDSNKAETGNGGALYTVQLLQARQIHSLKNSKYIKNDAGEDGGALLMNAFRGTTVDITYNEFIENNAANNGGAVAVYDGGVGYEIDEMVFNSFYGNTVNNDDTNTDVDRRSDIYLTNLAEIGNLSNNKLQFEPSAANYPSNYGLGSGNQWQTTALSTDYNAYSNNIPICEPLACPEAPKVPVTPIVVSSNKENSGNPEDYTSFTQVSVDPSCTPGYAEVGFTARSNDIALGGGIGGTINILEDPIPHLRITYKLIKTNSITGVSSTETKVIDKNTPNVRIEDLSINIPEDDGGTGTRDIYRAYFIPQTNLLTGHTYTYTVIKVEVIPSNGISRLYEYEPNIYRTTIVTDFCDSDQDGIPNYMESPNGVAPTVEDADNDGTPDYMDSDTSGFIDDNGDGIDDKYDTDGDGQADFLDIDADNDGILDSVESGMDANDPSAPTSPVDTDGDGVPDYLDLDSDNDGINDVDEGNPDAQDLDGDGMVDGPYGANGLADSLEGGDDTFGATVTSPVDTDGDGIPNYQDIDSDGDNIPDSVDPDPYGNGTVPQSQDPSADADGDGVIDVIKDTDGDGIPDVYDVDQTGGTDNDGNGIDDAAELVNNPSAEDSDGDGIINDYDQDKDGDGIIDVVDTDPNNFGEAKDSDGDGIPNYVESPNGIDPTVEDADNDGIPDYMDSDTPGFIDENGDGIDDHYDTDGDGKPDFLDLDADNDGIPDSIEAIDANHKDSSQPVDTDGDGVPDYLDLDSDNDSINDIDEARGVDIDGNGMVDEFTDVDGDGLHDPLDDQDLAVPNGNTPINNGTPLPLPNSDCPMPTTPCDEADYRDIDSDGDGIYDTIDASPYGSGTMAPSSQEPRADTDGDGIIDSIIDTDGDGIPDAYDKDQTGGADANGNGIDDAAEIVNNPGVTDTDGDGIIDSFDQDKDGDGIMDEVDGDPFVFGDKPTICEIDPNTSTNNIKPTKVGVSTLNRLSRTWLDDSNNKLGAYIILESTIQGFILPRFETTADILNNIGTSNTDGVEEGMIVWDKEANCLKMFYDNNDDGTMTWNCISSSSCKNQKP